MKRIFTLIATVILVMTANADTFSYQFSSTSLPKAIQKIMTDHPNLEINFIYNELENYRTSSTVNADNAYDALRQLIALNPVTVTKSKDSFYVEALQHGKYVYTGRVIGRDNEPVEAATVMLLTPKDSTVVTYGITDDAGRFSIPCDRQDVLAKLSCVGYKTTYRQFNSFNVGTIIMAKLSIELKTVTVEGENASLIADRSIYRPTQRQKNASQTATDLLNRMAIPQLSPSMGNTIKTNTGKDVNIYIDYQPASEQDLTGIRIEDVKRLEYYDYPKDPQFQGNAHVINFIMQKYEYGGYVKAYANEYIIFNTGQLNLYSKFQYKKMTYDLGVGGFFSNGKHDYSNSVETYRLPQDDGSIRQFERYSVTNTAESRRRYFWPTFKTLYRTNKISISNSIGATIDKYPKENTSGSVYFSQADLPQTDFISEANHHQSYITYIGNWNFTFPHGNTINFAPYYSYSQSKQNNRYAEGQSSEYINNAMDHTHKASGNFRFQHDFGKWGDLTVSVQTNYTNSKTQYTGTANAIDKLTTLRIVPGISYSYTSDKFYGMVFVGFNYDHSTIGGVTEKNTQPSVDLSLQYAFNNKNSLSIECYRRSVFPSLFYRSSTIIQSNPLMSYTGNPNLSPYEYYDFGVSYQWLPNNKFNFSLFGTGYVPTNRFAYVYEAYVDGILRTVQQPMGNFIQGSYGVNGTARLLDGKLQITGQFAYLIAKNGEPFNWTKSHPNWYLQAFYYLNQWHFGMQYQSHRSSADGFVKGIWVNSKNAYTAIVGWGNSSWNFQGQIANLFRWNWCSGSSVMKSKNYDFVQHTFSPYNHCFIYASATYTFGFGKKIKVGNEASQMSGAGNAILK